MGAFLDNFATVFLVGGSIALVVCGISIAKPNLHGTKFEEGTCQILSSSQLPIYHDLPTCSCGKNCNEEYPCVTVKATFEPRLDGKVEFFEGTIHKNYQALDKECLYVPDDCSREFETNAHHVYVYFVNNVVSRVDGDMRYPYLLGYNDTEIFYEDTSKFDCWGYDGAIYFDHNYTMTKVYLSLFLPVGCIVFGLILTVIGGTEEHRDCVLYMVLLPFVLIGGFISAIFECFGCDIRNCKKPDCCVDSTPRSRAAAHIATEREPRIRSVSPTFTTRTRSVSPTFTTRTRSVSPSFRIRRRTNSGASMGSMIIAMNTAPRRRLSDPYVLSRASIDSLELASIPATPTAPTAPSYPTIGTEAPPSYFDYSFNRPVDPDRGDTLPPPPSYDEVCN